MSRPDRVDLWALSDLSTPWCVHVVATLRIAEHLAAGKTRIDDLATASGADAEYLWRVLRHLVGKGVFEEPEPGRFALNEPARGLLESALRLGLDLDRFGGRMANAWSSLLSAVRTGAPAYHTVFGRPFWDDLQAHPEIADSFDALMGPAGTASRTRTCSSREAGSRCARSSTSAEVRERCWPRSYVRGRTCAERSSIFRRRWLDPRRSSGGPAWPTASRLQGRASSIRCPPGPICIC